MMALCTVGAPPRWWDRAAFRAWRDAGLPPGEWCEPYYVPTWHGVGGLLVLFTGGERPVWVAPAELKPCDPPRLPSCVHAGGPVWYGNSFGPLRAPGWSCGDDLGGRP